MRIVFTTTAKTVIIGNNKFETLTFVKYALTRKTAVNTHYYWGLTAV